MRLLNVSLSGYGSASVHRKQISNPQTAVVTAATEIAMKLAVP